MAATVWSGYLTFGLISLPVRLFSGARGTRVAFRMLHRDDHVPVKTQLYCPEEDKVIDRSEVVKGFEYRKGEFVVVEPEEIRKVEPPTSKAMEILEFVRRDQVDPIYFETSYYLVPEEAGRRPYALLSQALEDSEYVAIAKLSMHNREYTVILRPYQGGILLHTMYYADEIRQVEQFDRPREELKAAELKVANQLIEALAADFEPEKYSDTFEENVKQLIQAKLEGVEAPAVEAPRRPAPVVDLMSALKQSLSQMEGKKEGRKKPAASAGEARPARAPRRKTRKAA